MVKIFINASNQSGNPYSYAGTNEKAQMERLAALLKKELDKYNCESKIAESYYIRDKAIEAKNWGATFAIALHSNAAKGSASGTQGYYNRNYQVSKNIAQRLVNNINAINPNSKNASRIVDDYSYLDVLEFGSRGVPSLLAEVAFHDNPSEARWIVENMDIIAVAVAKCFVDEYRLTSKSSTPSVAIPTEPAPSAEVLYRVQVGAFANRKNADNMEAKLKSAGYPTYMVQVDGLFKVQTGAFSVKENADRLAAELKAKGFDVYITNETGAPATPKNDTLKVGDRVRVMVDSIDLNANCTVDTWVYGSILTVLDINGNRVTVSSDGRNITGVFALSRIYKV